MVYIPEGMYVCPIGYICMYVSSSARVSHCPSPPALGVGDVKAYLIIVEPNLTHNLVLLGMLVFTI